MGSLFPMETSVQRFTVILAPLSRCLTRFSNYWSDSNHLTHKVARENENLSNTSIRGGVGPERFLAHGDAV